MHEMSFIKSLLQQVEKVLAENDAIQPVEIKVEIGPLTGVEIDLVRSAYAQRVVGTRYASTALVINEVPLVIRCLRCQAETELSSFVFRCSQCPSCSVQVISGDAFRLKSVLVCDNDETSPHHRTSFALRSSANRDSSAS
jgi:hydrogenase nickel incorporation protein HypA/HybF